jgi:hypothetical protein
MGRASRAKRERREAAAKGATRTAQPAPPASMRLSEVLVNNEAYRLAHT